MPSVCAPGDTVILVGDRLEEDAIYLYHLPDDRSAAPGQTLDISTIDPDRLPTGSLITLPAIARNALSVSGVIPADLARGQYVLWARNGEQWSNPVTINRTDVYFVYPDRLNVATDRRVRVIGNNFDLEAKPAPIVALRGEDGVVYPVQPKNAEPYHIAFDLPTSVPIGTYEVWVSNGYGGASGWSKPQTLTVVDQPRSELTFSIMDYGAAPKAQDNQRAIQAAIDAAHDAGGGVVTVPAGTFIIRGPIHLRGGVTLRGLGNFKQNKFPSTIQFYDDPDHALTAPDASHIVLAESDTVMEGIHLVGSRSVDRGIVIPPGASDLVFHDNYIDVFHPTYTDKKNPNDKSFYGGITAIGRDGERPAPIFRVQITNNLMDGRGCVNFENVHESRIAGNMIHGRINTPLIYCAVSRTIMEHNHVDGRDVDGTEGAARGFTANVCNRAVDRAGFRGTELNYFADNLIEYVGTWNSFRNNNGEYINFDCLGDSRFAGTYYYRQVVSARPDTVTVDNVSARDCKPTPWNNDRLTGTDVMVVYGTGTGQMRTIAGNDGDTLKLTRPWTVPPDATSKIVTARFFDRNILYRNKAQHNKGNCYLLWGLCTNMIVDGNTAAEEGVMIAGCDNHRNPDQYALSYYNLVQNNHAPSLTIQHRAPAALPYRASYLLLGNVLRDNVADREMGILQNRDNAPGVTTIVNLFEGNSLPDGVKSMDGATDTIVRNNTIQTN